MDAQDAVTQPGGKQRGRDPLVGKTLAGRFEIEELINRGGMGKIYRARQMPLGRSVALKVLDIHDDGSEFRDRFFLEASLCAKLAHPNTIRIYDYGATDDGIYFIAMEYIKGESMQQLLNRVGAMAPGRAVAIALQIAGALAEAHDVGIVHRDLKPGNVMLTDHGDTEFVKVLDFGLVKELGKESELSRTGTVLGSPLYIAPEQVHGTAVDGRADIYTTGLMLYAMLMGKTAFERGNPLHVLMQQTQKQPPPFAEANPEAKVLGSIEWVVMTCLEKKPENRFRSMHELIRALKACTKELGGDVDSLRMKLVDGEVVLPEGLEVSEVRLPAFASGQTTCLHRTQDTDVEEAHDSPSQSTLMSTRPIRTVAMVVGGGSVFGGLVLGGLGLLLMVVIAGNMLMRDDPPPPAPAPVVVAPPPAPVPAAAEKVEITLTSSPEGASVQRDGVLLGSTPLIVRLTEGEQMAVEVMASGYGSQKVVLSSDVPSPLVTLTRRRPRPSPKPKPAPAPAPVPEPAPVEQPAPVPQPKSNPEYDGVDMKDPEWGDE